MTDIMSKLQQADAYLERISVNGSNVFLLAEARRTLKDVYDALNSKKDGDKNG